MAHEIIEATPEHIEYIIKNLRRSDILEAIAVTGGSYDVAVRISVLLSDVCLSGLCEGIPVCLFGVVPASMVERSGRIWLVGTDNIDKYKLTFLRENRRLVKDLLNGYDLLYNYVDCRNKTAIKWLRWLGFGFGFDEPVLYGAHQLPFMRFEMVKNGRDKTDRGN